MEMSKLLAQMRSYVFAEGPAISLCIILIVADIFLSYAIVVKVPYTEIDWKAYMEEVEGYENGERNYTNIRGNTGPLVYPAGFLYLFSFLKRVTSEGEDIFRAQVIFAVIYITTLAFSLILYHKGKMPAFCAVFLILSKRVHSIFMLRLFNDCIAVLLGMVAVVCFGLRKWRLGSVIFSLSVSIKMNMLLFAPGVLAVYLLHVGYMGAIENIFICGVVQLLLGYPFLSTYPVEYISKAFELGRVFFYKWTVNFRFLPEDLFLDKRLSIALLLLTILGYVTFAYRWTSQFTMGFKSSFPQHMLHMTAKAPTIGKFVSWNFITYVIFTSNFIGIAFARSLHYQFYCWYFFTLPFLLFQTKLPSVVNVALLGCIEFSFNVFPATALSSAVLQIAHLVILVALWFSNVPFREGLSVGKLSLSAVDSHKKQ